MFANKNSDHYISTEVAASIISFILFLNSLYQLVFGDYFYFCTILQVFTYYIVRTSYNLFTGVNATKYLYIVQILNASLYNMLLNGAIFLNCKHYFINVIIISCSIISIAVIVIIIVTFLCAVV